MIARLFLAAFLFASGSAFANPIERHVALSKDATVLVGATVPSGTSLTFLSAKLPANPDGSTEAQAANIFDKLDKSLAKLGLGLGNIVKITVYLVAPTGQMRPDYDGFDRAYRARFGTAKQPELVAQSIMQVSGLRDPRLLVAIDVVAAGKTATSPSATH